jgi:hypothetical protein
MLLLMKDLSILIGALLLFTFNVNGADAGCPPGQYRVRGHNRSGYVRSNGTVVGPANVKSYCKLLTKAYEYSKERFKKGVPANWPHSTEKAGAWTEGEKERIIETLEELPDVLLSDKIAGIYRLKKSKDIPNPASSSDGVIVIYDSGFDTSRNLERIVAHELSHQNYRDLSNAEKQDYRRATGWHLKLESNGKIFWVGRKDGYIEEDEKIHMKKTIQIILSTIFTILINLKK